MTQFIKPQIEWTPEKIVRLQTEYPLGDKKTLCSEFGITYEALKSAAARFNTKSLKDKHNYKLKPLYEDSIISYYWMGFIMADGHIDNEGELKIVLSSKDREHLIKLAKMLNVKVSDHSAPSSFKDGTTTFYSRMSCKDVHYGKLLLTKFGLNGMPKTYNPPLLEIPMDKYFIAFLLGMIDGDGTFSKTPKGKASFIRLEMHSAWMSILMQISKRLKNIGIMNICVGYTARNYAFLKIYKHQNLRAMKIFSIYYQLPRLDRKWDSIDENKQVSYMKINDISLDSKALLNL